MIKIYIDDFCNDLNYKEVILYIGQVETSKLKQRLIDDCVNHMHRFDKIINDGVDSNFMYIENCDLQDLTYKVQHYIAEGYSILTLHEDRHGAYYVEIDI